MTDQSAAPNGGSDITVVSLPEGAPESFSSPESVMSYLAKQREKDSSAESAETATAEQELSGEDNAAPRETEATGETQEADPAAKPPLELPRSWTKDRTEHWAKLDPDTQEFLLEQDRKASAEVRRVQNEAAEKLKGLTAKEQQLEQARQQYEAKLSSSVKFMEQALQSEFGDIQSLNDVRNLQANDPFRFQAWQVRQMELTAAKAEESAAEQRQAGERQTSWSKFVQDESAAFAETVPEYTANKADYDKKAAETLRDLGFTDAELNKLASGEDKIPLFDRRIQRLLFDRIKLSEIRSAPKAVAAKPVPPVQRPGTSSSRGDANAEKVQTIDKALTNSGSFNDAFALLQARRASR